MVQKLLSGASQTTENDDSSDDTDHQEIARKHLDEWGSQATEIIHCELCDTIYISYDVFYDHRMASDDDYAAGRVDGRNTFPQWSWLGAGEELPDGTGIGGNNPCPGTESE